MTTASPLQDSVRTRRAVSFDTFNERADTRSGLLAGIPLTWETAAYIAILLLALFTRFYILGDRVMSHDESLHTKFSFDLYREGNFVHTPLMHGPILFHATALSYFLFGDTDYAARLYPAILGVIMTVLFPLLFKRWLGTWGSLLMAVMLLISPIWMYYNRYIREDTPNIFAAILMVYCFFMYVDGPRHLRRKGRWLYIAAAAMLWMLGSKETGFMYLAIFALFIGAFWLLRLYQHFRKVPTRSAFNGLIIATLIGCLVALTMYCVLSIALQPFPSLDNRLNYLSSQLGGLTSGAGVGLEAAAFFNWTALTILAAVTLVIGTVFYAFRHHLGRMRFAEVVAVLLIVVAVSVLLIYIEELTQVPATPEPTTAEVPGEASAEVVIGGVAARELGVIIGTWIGAGIVIVGLLYIYQRGWWRTLYRFAELDLLVLMITMVLPWATPILIAMTGNSPTDYSSAGIQRAVALGLPLAAISITFGLTWHWRRWLISLACFYVPFVFFFTTMFTNPQGLATGIIGSLGYWLEQQEVRRGSQPQYYYPLIVMPMYEFLPIVGSFLAMLAGIVLFWRERINEMLYNDSISDEKAKRDALYAYTDDVGTTYRSSASAISESPELPATSFYEPSTDAVGTGRASSATTTEDDIQLQATTTYALTPDDIEAARVRSTPIDPLVLGGNIPFAPPLTDMDALRERYGTRDGVVQDPRRFRLTRMSFILFMAWLAVGNLLAYTLAGEKMPWLGTHLTIPMIAVAAWYFGRVFERIDWRVFTKRGWLLLILLPLLFIVGFQVLQPFLVGETVFGLEQAQLARTNQWLATIAVGALVIYGIWRVAKGTGWRHVRRMVAVALFSLLAVLTFRAAWTASFINYDYATEFLVYAHAAPGWTLMMDQIEDISRRTTDGLDIRFAWGGNAWPASWYFRDLRNATYFGTNPTPQQLNDVVAVYASADIRSRVEPLLEDRFVRFDYTRMWWPMQDYFNLSAQRVNTVFDFSGANPQSSEIRRGLFDIWWSRDYRRYGQAVGGDYSVTNWPVSETMSFYVRKDVAAQIWSLGVGDVVATNLDDVTAVNQCVANWQSLSANLVFDQPSTPLNHPLDVEVGDDGRIYVADEFGNRVVVYDEDGQVVDEFTTASSQTGLFTRPNGVALSPDGELVVADTWNYRVQLVDREGLPIMGWGQPLQAGAGAGEVPIDGLWGPRDVTTDSNGNIYVSDTGNKRVRVYDAVGNFLRDIGSGGALAGQLDEPAGLTVANGQLFVADTWNRRVSVFNLDGSPAYQFPVRGWYEDLGNRPYLALDEGRNQLYVTDPDAGRVLVYDAQGNCLGSFGQPGDAALAANQFRTTAGVAVDDAGNVYVVDSGGNRVLRFAPFEAPPPTAEGESEAAG
jgi:uncharacterized protein (TIGR03663 family)